MLSLGAIIKNTKQYVYPLIANKNNKFECPECHRDLILRQGNKRVHHFSHYKSVNPCNYYEKPNETQIHKNAKLLMKKILDDKIQFVIKRICRCCEDTEEYEIPERDNTSNIIIEYRFEYNGTKIADVAFIENNEIIAIFEICNTHKTDKENRPEPWFEIDAVTLINIANTESSQNSILNIPCIRNELCDKCIKENICKGSGECLRLLENNRYIKNQDWKCSYKCVPMECYHCNEITPRHMFNNNICMDCGYQNKIEICNGYGECLDPNTLQKHTNYDCSFNCIPIKCSNTYCKTWLPKLYLGSTYIKNVCRSCDMNAIFDFPKDVILLDVPFSQKDYIKSLGAKFYNKYKKWCIKNDNKNKDIILSIFKEWKCPS